MNRSLGIFLVASTFFIANCFAETDLEKQDRKNLNINNDVNSTTQVYRTYREATNDSNVTKWTSKDFQQSQGGSSGLIGNTRMFLNSLDGGDSANSGNPNAMTTQGIQEDQKFDDIESLNVWTQDFQEDIISGALSQGNKLITKDGTVKCYITRNIPIRFQCSHTLLTYGEGMGENGMEARRQCENECYEQYGCVDVSKNVVAETKTLENITINSNTADNPTIIKEATKKEVLTSESILNKIVFKVDGVKDRTKKAYIDIFYSNYEKDDLYLVGKMLLTIDPEKELSLNIDDFVKDVTIKLYTEDDEVEIILTDITLKYKENKEFVCPKHQDISTKNPGDFARLCPSGNILDFTVGLKNYKICADYGVLGNNLNGTFATEDSCNAICRTNHSCVMNYTQFNTDILKESMEGCIEGQTNCELDTCNKLRLNGNRVLNENVFRAGENAIHTIINGTQQVGVTRPRVLLSDDLDFTERNLEEWKDEAYQYMIDNNRYAQSLVTLDQDTEISQAYNMGISSGVSYGYSLTGSRALFGIIKPRAYDVNNNINYKFYAIVDAIIERYVFDQNAQRVKVKDRILYIKNSDTEDELKPFAVKREFGKNVILEDEEGVSYQEHTENETAVWEYKSFNNNSWYSHSSSSNAEYFKDEQIVIGERPYLRIETLKNMNFIAYNLPGIARSITTNGLNQTNHYDGDYDGTGEALARFNVYLHYSSTNLTYSDLVTMVDEKDILPIYDNLTPSAFSKEVVGDSGEVGADINIYQYGPINKKSAYLRIFPKQEELGKKGFIYVFGY